MHGGFGEVGMYVVVAGVKKETGFLSYQKLWARRKQLHLQLDAKRVIAQLTVSLHPWHENGDVSACGLHP